MLGTPMTVGGVALRRSHRKRSQRNHYSDATPILSMNAVNPINPSFDEIHDHLDGTDGNAENTKPARKKLRIRTSNTKPKRGTNVLKQVFPIPSDTSKHINNDIIQIKNETHSQTKSTNTNTNTNIPVVQSSYSPTYQTPQKKKSKQASSLPKITPSPSSPKKRQEQIIKSSDLAKIAPHNSWIDLHVPPSELRPSTTLTTGQCFSWIPVYVDTTTHLELPIGTKDENETTTTPRKSKSNSAWGTHDAIQWVGPFGPHHVLSIRETPTTTLYRVLYDQSQPSSSSSSSNTTSTTTCPSGKEEPLHDQIKHYFQLHIPLTPLYQKWSKQDPSHRLSRIAKAIVGVRVLQQDPIECLFSFLCSSNNNIPRITLILSRFRAMYGEFCLEIPSYTWSSSSSPSSSSSSSSSLEEDPLLLPSNPIRIHSFPTLTSMKSATESDLRELGFGYRAKYVIQSRDLLLQRGGSTYLYHLRNDKKYTHETIQTQLLDFMGIGRKVADCIALFSLNCDDAIPVDVHVWNIAKRDYHSFFQDNGHNVKTVKTVTPAVYKKVGDIFRTIFCNDGKAGWAHSLLFVAELPSFRLALPEDMIQEMDEWKIIESEMKATNKKKQQK